MYWIIEQWIIKKFKYNTINDAELVSDAIDWDRCIINETWLLYKYVDWSTQAVDWKTILNANWWAGRWISTKSEPDTYTLAQDMWAGELVYSSWNEEVDKIFNKQLIHPTSTWLAVSTNRAYCEVSNNRVAYTTPDSATWNLHLFLWQKESDWTITWGSSTIISTWLIYECSIYEVNDNILISAHKDQWDSWQLKLVAIKINWTSVDSIWTEVTHTQQTYIYNPMVRWWYNSAQFLATYRYWYDWYWVVWTLNPINLDITLEPRVMIHTDQRWITNEIVWPDTYLILYADRWNLNKATWMFVTISWTTLTLWSTNVYWTQDWTYWDNYFPNTKLWTNQILVVNLNAASTYDYILLQYDASLQTLTEIWRSVISMTPRSLIEITSSSFAISYADWSNYEIIDIYDINTSTWASTFYDSYTWDRTVRESALFNNSWTINSVIVNYDDSVLYFWYISISWIDSNNLFWILQESWTSWELKPVARMWEISKVHSWLIPWEVYYIQSDWSISTTYSKYMVWYAISDSKLLVYQLDKDFNLSTFEDYSDTNLWYYPTTYNWREVKKWDWFVIIWLPANNKLQSTTYKIWDIIIASVDNPWNNEQYRYKIRQIETWQLSDEIMVVWEETTTLSLISAWNVIYTLNNPSSYSYKQFAVYENWLRARGGIYSVDHYTWDVTSSIDTPAGTNLIFDYIYIPD